MRTNIQNYKDVILFPKYISLKIPQQWNCVHLSDVTEKITDRDHTTPIYLKDGVPIISPTNFNDDMELDLTNVKYISKEDHEKNYSKTDIRPYDIIFSRIGSVGKSYLIKDNFFNFSILHSLCQIRTNDKILPIFLLWHLRSNLIQKRMWVTIQSIGVPDLGLKEIGNLPVLLPPLPEQQKIASILSNVDSLIQQTQNEIEHTQKLKKGLMQRLLIRGIGHTKFVKSEIGLIPKEWEFVQLEDACLKSKYSFSMGPFGSDIKTDNFVPAGVPVIRGVNLTKEPFNEDGFVFVTEEKADELRAANAFPNDLIFTHRGTLGQVGIIPLKAKFKRYVVSQSQMKCVCNNEILNPMFAFYYFLSELGQKIILKHSTKSGVPHIVQPLTSLRRFPIPLPRIEEQDKIVKILYNVSVLIDKGLVYKLHLEILKKGLMQKLLTGQIRVKV